MSFDNKRTLELKDPRAMRALAHPTRIAIIDLLSAREQATATECSEVVGQSPSACSFHLRSLARWGIVERAGGGKGRQRPWRMAVSDLRWSSGVGRSGPFRAAANLLSDQYLRRDERFFLSFLEREEELEPEWQDAMFASRSTLVMTREELQELGEKVLALYEPFLRRKRKDRPEDAREVYAIFRAFPRLGQ